MSWHIERAQERVDVRLDFFQGGTKFTFLPTLLHNSKAKTSKYVLGSFHQHLRSPHVSIIVIRKVWCGWNSILIRVIWNTGGKDAFLGSIPDLQLNIRKQPNQKMGRRLS